MRKRFSLCKKVGVFLLTVVMCTSQLNVQAEKKEAYIATDQAERSIILKGTHIGKDTCLYFYAEKGGYFYEMDPKQAEEKILRLVEKNVVCEQVKKILIGD